MSDGSFLAELRKRKVVQAAAIYGAVAWGVTEILVTVVEQLFLPQWVSTLAVIGFVVGFPVAMFLAWIFDITSEGIRRTEVTSRRGKATILLSLLLLVAGTAGLFFLIKPSLHSTGRAVETRDIPPNSIAVLPFENAGLEPGDAYLSEGLSDELRDQLGRVAGIRMAARSSSRMALQQRLDALDASAKLGVANLVEGSIRRNGRKLRISVQLIEGSSGLALWSETYERGPRELLDVQQAIAEQIVARLMPGVAVVATPATLSVSANEAMLLARFYEQQVRDQQLVDHEKLDEAIRLYRQAVKADPDSALAHSRLAGALLFREGAIESAEAPIFRALSLDPNLSEVQNTLGEFYWARGLPDAGAAFARAVELNPDNPDALHNYATWRWFQGEIEGIAELYARAVDVDRLSLARYAALGDYLGKEGLADEAVEVASRIQALFDDANAYRAVAWILELSGRVDEAIAWTLRARDREPGNPDHVSQLAELYAVIGDFETALRLEPDPGLGMLFYLRRYDELIDEAEMRMLDFPEDMEVRYLLAFAYNATGQFESALHVLKSTGAVDAIIEQRIRSAGEIMAFNDFIDALNASGNVELAQELARSGFDLPWWARMIDWQSKSWMVCSLVVLERREEALQLFEKIKESPRLPWDPVLRDFNCYKDLKVDPRYTETMEFIDARRAELRSRLPSTLAEFGVRL